jgi:hypothetical protein
VKITGRRDRHGNATNILVEANALSHAILMGIHFVRSCFVNPTSGQILNLGIFFGGFTQTISEISFVRTRKKSPILLLVTK